LGTARTEQVGKTAFTLRSGRPRAISFRLNQAGVNAPTKNHALDALTLVAVTRDGHGATVANKDLLGIVVQSH
jgi:hypothetical protein